jgi:hypothetical protein
MTIANDCGGITVSNVPDFTGQEAFFDTTGRLVGESSESDFVDKDGCTGRTSGRKCSPAANAAPRQHDCPGVVDGGNP